MLDAISLRKLQNGMFATKGSMQELETYIQNLAPQERQIAFVIMGMTVNTTLETLAKMQEASPNMVVPE